MVKKQEAYERLTVDVPSNFQGVIMEKLGSRKAIMQDMSADQTDRIRIDFNYPCSWSNWFSH